MMQRAHDRLSVLVSHRFPAPLPGSNRTVVKIESLNKLVEAMPKCMSRLHERAIGECGPDDYLRFEQRSIYYRFMLASGVNRALLFDIQAPAHYNHPERKKPIDNKYMKTIEAEVNATAKWLRKMNSTFKGDGCKALFEKGICGHGKGSATLGQAQYKCQRAAADALDIEDTVKPSGLPLMYAQQMRKDLDSKQ